MHTPIAELTSAELAADPSLTAAILELNNAHAIELSLLTSGGLVDRHGVAGLAHRSRRRRDDRARPDGGLRQSEPSLVPRPLRSLRLCRSHRGFAGSPRPGHGAPAL